MVKRVTRRPRPVQDSAPSLDSFVNFAHKLGVGADNALSSASYGFNPITRDRTLLEYIHRGSWIGGVAVDLIADDMTKAGIEYLTEMAPEDIGVIDRVVASIGIWSQINAVVKWGSLYGGAIGVAMIDGQDVSTPLRMETVAEGMFKGILVFDRWSVTPDQSEIIEDMGPDIGKPMYYRVEANAPALRGQKIHQSRVLFRYLGVELPHTQAQVENGWGLSVIERLYDRMIAFDSATTGAAQLVYKSHLQTLSVEDLRQVVAAGGKPMEGLTAYVNMMRRFRTNEGFTVIDSKDSIQTDQHSAFGGLSDVLMQFGQQISGALQIPLVRLFGQSPAGLSASGESDIRTYYDRIKSLQEKHLLRGVQATWKILARSCGVTLPDEFTVGFRSLWDLSDTEKSTIAQAISMTVVQARDAGLVSDKIAMRELRQSSRKTGVFTNITEEDIEAADDTLGPPPGELEPDPTAPETVWQGEPMSGPELTDGDQ